MVYNAHYFTNLSDAKSALHTVNTGEGYPIAGGKTVSYTEVYEHEDGYIIQADEVTRKYIKDEIVITVNNDNY